MTNTQDQTKQMFKDVIEALEEATGLELCIAGGAVRDMLHGKPIKDLDVEVLNFDKLEVGRHNDEVLPWVEKIAERLEDFGATDVEVFNEYEGASLDAHVDFIIKIKAMGFDIDIILRDTHPDTVESLLSLYDMNLNQVAFYKGKVNIINPILGNKIVPTGKFVSLERVKRMYKKYPEYDFSAMLNFIEEPVSQCETPKQVGIVNGDFDTLVSKSLTYPIE